MEHHYLVKFSPLIGFERINDGILNTQGDNLCFFLYLYMVQNNFFPISFLRCTWTLQRLWEC